MSPIKDFYGVSVFETQSAAVARGHTTNIAIHLNNLIDIPFSQIHLARQYSIAKLQTS